MQVSDEDLTTLKNATKAVFARVERLGKAVNENFRADVVYTRPNDFETACSIVKSIDNTLGAVEADLAVVKKLREERDALAKQVSELQAFGAEQVEKFERLTKGEIECPGCAGSGKDGDRECKKCEGEKYVSVR